MQDGSCEKSKAQSPAKKVESHLFKPTFSGMRAIIHPCQKFKSEKKVKVLWCSDTYPTAQPNGHLDQLVTFFPMLEHVEQESKLHHDLERVHQDVADQEDAGLPGGAQPQRPRQDQVHYGHHHGSEENGLLQRKKQFEIVCRSVQIELVATVFKMRGENQCTIL